LSLLSVSDTNIFRNESRSYYSFLAMYLVLVFAILGSLGSMYYNFQKQVMLSQLRLQLQLQSHEYIDQIYTFKKQFEQNKYQEYEDLYSAIYDEERKKVFSNLHSSPVNLHKVISLNQGYLQYVVRLAENNINASFLVLEMKDDEFWFEETLKTMLIYGSSLLILLSLVGMFLSKQFLKPMRDSIHLLDNFIKDTTHELNTPLTTILNNVNRLSNLELEDKDKKKLIRIFTATKTISGIYDDLVTLSLQKHLETFDAKIDLNKLIIHRVEYFKDKADSKQLQITYLPTQDIYLYADKKLITKLLDNLLSNAIKYNIEKGDIFITLNPKSLEIKNSGQSVSKTQSKELFKRYSRRESPEGGFGIGLHIVSNIVEHYGYQISMLEAKPNGTKVILSW